MQSRKLWTNLAGAIKFLQTTVEKTIFFSTLANTFHTPENADSPEDTTFPQTSALIVGASVSLALAVGVYICNSILIGLNQDSDSEDENEEAEQDNIELVGMLFDEPAIAEDAKSDSVNDQEEDENEETKQDNIELVGILFGEPAIAEDAKSDSVNDQEEDDEQETTSLIATPIDDYKPNLVRPQSSLAKCDKYVTGITLQEISLVIDCAGATALGDMLLSYALKHPISVTESLLVKLFGILIGLGKVYPDSRTYVGQLRKHGIWPPRRTKNTGPDIWARYDGLSEFFLTIPEQAMLIGGVIDLYQHTSTPTGFPTYANLMKGTLISVGISAGEAWFHVVLDWISSQQSPETKIQNNTDGCCNISPTPLKIKAGLLCHILTDILVCAGFVSCLHLLIANGEKHNVTPEENLTFKAIGVMLGGLYTVAPTRGYVTMLKRSNLWKSIFSSSANENKALIGTDEAAFNYQSAGSTPHPRRLRR